MAHNQIKAINPTQITEIANKHNAQAMLNTEIEPPRVSRRQF